MSSFRDFFAFIRKSSVRRRTTVQTVSMGRERTFEAYDLGADTFIFERGVSRRRGERPSVLIVEKRDLGRKSRGRILAMSTGNHAVAALPLLDGRFWQLSALEAARRSEALRTAVICANVVGERLEISQREVSTERIVAADEWLRSHLDLALGDVVLLERNELTLEHYRRLGMEWRVKPLAWSAEEIRAALDASKKRIATGLVYYHSGRGVHLLSFSEFRRFAQLAKSDPAAFASALKELVGEEAGRLALARQPKYRGHYEIEFFGLRRGVAMERLVPALEDLLAELEGGRLARLELVRRAAAVADLYESLLTNPQLGDENSQLFIETIYMYVTGEIYAVQGEGSTRAFDDRRTALPGATFVGGRPVMHPGADERTEVLMSNLRGMLSKDEFVEYANVYELRSEGEETRLGTGSTREIVYKSNCRPIECSLVEKELARSAPGYTDYMLARLGGMRALGIGLSEYYRVLRRRAGESVGKCDYYIRRRCEGEPMSAIPAHWFRISPGSTCEDPEFVLQLASLIGDAAAQNLAMKKYDPRKKSALFGIGKEIYEFEYDLERGRMMPKSVRICSVRGSFGWPTLAFTDANCARYGKFYLKAYAAALRNFAANHPSVPAAKIVARFLSGFEYRTRTLARQLSVMRDRFEAFDPELPPAYDFRRRWGFVLWALDRQNRDLARIRQVFADIFCQERRFQN